MENDLTGKRFFRLTVISYYGIKSGAKHWNCICDCGNTSIVQGSKLTGGKVKSCGCWKNENAKKQMTKHGLYQTSEYSVWEGIKQRCYNKNYKQYKDYGGRDIFVCDEWKDNPEAFCKWAKEHGHKKGLELDRIDNDGPYSPDNCRFVTRKVQALNKRSNVLITYNGETDNICSWAKRLGVHYQLLKYRLEHGWSIEKAFSTPPLNK